LISLQKANGVLSKEALNHFSKFNLQLNEMTSSQLIHFFQVCSSDEISHVQKVDLSQIVELLQKNLSEIDPE
jgi:hypothetical protein